MGLFGVLLSASLCGADEAEAGDIFGFGSVENIKSKLENNNSAPKKSGVDLAALVRPNDSLCVIRGARWGMSRDEIKNSESASLLKDGSTELVFRQQEAQAVCLITYYFSANALKGIRLEIQQPSSNPTGYYTEFENVSVQLCKTAGVPDKRNYQWTDATYRNDRTRWGQSIAEGKLSCHLVWKTSNARIELTSKGSPSSFATIVTASPL